MASLSKEINMKTSFIPIYLQNLFNDMTFIGNIPPNHKLCVKSRSYSDSSSWVGWGYRKIESESADLSVTFIHETCVASSQAYYANGLFRNIILDKINLLLNGIKNIQKTYCRNVKISNSLETPILILNLVNPNNNIKNINYREPDYDNFINQNDKKNEEHEINIITKNVI